MIPCFNEAANLPQLIQEIQESELPSHCDILFVDDGSNDASASLLDAAGFPVIHHSGNFGYGASIKSGLRYAKRQNYRNLAVYPGDRQRSLADLLQLIRLAENSSVDVVVGSKFHSLRKIPLRRAWGNRFFSQLAKILWRSPFSDVLSGFKVYRVSSVSAFFEQLPDRYEFDLIFSLYCRRHGLAVKEIPVSVRYHAHSTKMKSLVAVGMKMLAASVKSLNHRGPKPVPLPLGE